MVKWPFLRPFTSQPRTLTHLSHGAFEIMWWHPQLWDCYPISQMSKPSCGQRSGVSCLGVSLISSRGAKAGFLFFFFLLVVLGVWTQVFTLARQVLYTWATLPAPVLTFQLPCQFTGSLPSSRNPHTHPVSPPFSQYSLSISSLPISPFL
jgi:hypothetical protein